MQLEVQAERKRIRDEKARVDALMDDVERRYSRVPLTNIPRVLAPPIWEIRHVVSDTFADHGHRPSCAYNVISEPKTFPALLPCACRERIMSSPLYALGMTVPEAVSGGLGAGPMARRPATAGGERPGLQRVSLAKSRGMWIPILQSSATTRPKSFLAFGILNPRPQTQGANMRPATAASPNRTPKP
jgi:hypothetical protein